MFANHIRCFSSWVTKGWLSNEYFFSIICSNPKKSLKGMEKRGNHSKSAAIVCNKKSQQRKKHKKVSSARKIEHL
jgi:hypothetical protein